MTDEAKASNYADKAGGMRARARTAADSQTREVYEDLAKEYERLETEPRTHSGGDYLRAGDPNATDGQVETTEAADEERPRPLPLMIPRNG